MIIKVFYNKIFSYKKDLNLIESVTIEKIIIFLPPTFHLLMKFHIYKEYTIIEIKTDFWRVLVCLDEFFDELLEIQKEILFI